MSFFDFGQGGQQPTEGRVSTPYRRNPQTGYLQVQVPDPDRRGYVMWVDALWDPVLDRLVPIDPRYRDSGETYPAQRWGNSFADSNGGMDFSGPLDVGLLAANADSAGTSTIPSLARRDGSTDNSSGILLLVGVLVVIYVISG